ncbi:TspO/MBR family protein [Tessaracoccus antarcticus]|nr:TspO/MBR family protein [Tessaracoccus antarcticus]
MGSSNDLARQITVTASEIFCVVGTLFGIGVIGTRVQESSGGALASDATLLAPDGPAFSIWSIIYAGLLAYTIWQWLPRNKTSTRHRAIGWLAAASMILNAVWLLVTQVGAIWVSVIVILALAVVLGSLLGILQRHPAEGTADKVITDGTFGLYLGWVTAATCANVTAAGVSSGWDLGTVGNQVLAVVILIVAIGLGVAFTLRLGPRFTVTAALAWGLAWIGIGRSTSDPQSTAVSVAAFAAAAVLLVFWFIRWQQQRRSTSVA